MQATYVLRNGCVRVADRLEDVMTSCEDFAKNAGAVALELVILESALILLLPNMILFCD